MPSNFPVKDPQTSNENNVRDFLEIPEYRDTKVEDARTHVNELCASRGILIQKLQEDCKKLKDEQRKITEELESNRKAFGTITAELKKQLDSAKQGESEAQSQMFGLRLENKKLKVLLESERSLVEMLKKELLGVKRTLKFAIKDCINGSRLLSAADVGYELQSPPITQTHTPQVPFSSSLDVIDSPSKKTP